MVEATSAVVQCTFPKLRGAPQFWKTSPTGADGWNFGLFWGVKTPKNAAKFFVSSRHTYKKYFLQKNWVKTAIPALSGGKSNLHPPIWGRHRQLDDHHRNPNTNGRDHLVGQLTRGAPPRGYPSVLREWIMKVREVKVKKILFHFLFEK